MCHIGIILLVVCLSVPLSRNTFVGTTRVFRTKFVERVHNCCKCSYFHMVKFWHQVIAIMCILLFKIYLNQGRITVSRLFFSHYHSLKYPISNSLSHSYNSINFYVLKSLKFYYTHRNEVRGGILESPCPSVCLSVRPSVCRRAVR